MEHHEVEIKIADGQKIKGLDIPIAEASERFNDYTLDDGTVLRAKLVVSSVVRVKDQWDADGHPVYTIQSHNVVRVVQSHPSLRQAK